MDLNITQEQLDRWVDGNELIQNIFPSLTKGEREFLVTGITPEEWRKEFGWPKLLILQWTSMGSRRR